VLGGKGLASFVGVAIGVRVGFAVAVAGGVAVGVAVAVNVVVGDTSVVVGVPSAAVHPVIMSNKKQRNFRFIGTTSCDFSE